MPSKEVISRWLEDEVTVAFFEKVQDFKEEADKKLKGKLELGEIATAQHYNGRLSQAEDVFHIIKILKEEAE